MTKRRQQNDGGNITPRMVQLYRQLCDISDVDGEKKWEAEGGRRSEYLAANSELDQLAHRKPWQISVWHTIDHWPDAPPASEKKHETALRDWAGARAIATALEDAVAREDA